MSELTLTKFLTKQPDVPKNLIIIKDEENNEFHWGLFFHKVKYEGLNKLQTLDLKKNDLGNSIGFINTEMLENHLIDALSMNPKLNIVNLDNNQISDNGIKVIGKGLKSSKMTKLSLRKNKFGNLGAKYLAEALKKNQSLTDLNLEENQIGDEGAKYLAEALKKNQSLTNLNLGENQIGDDGAKYLAEALKKNQSLTNLNLGNNKIGNLGAIYLSGALENNKTLAILNLEMNQIGVGGVKELSEKLAIKQNLTVQLKNNRIPDSEILERFVEEKNWFRDNDNNLCHARVKDRRCKRHTTKVGEGIDFVCKGWGSHLKIWKTKKSNLEKEQKEYLNIKGELKIE